MLKEFREFAIRGSMVDLAIGIIIGAAFNGLVSSLVSDVIMPIPGALVGRLDFSNYLLPLNGQHYASLALAKAAGAPAIYYGLFINQFINFTITALVAFFIVRAVNRLRRRQEGAPQQGPKDKDCPYCHTTIPVKAIRCPNCTSDLRPEPAAAAPSVA
ncbi:MAG: large conductance mechanosensitive channel protein MscL [Rudaea sp.]